MGSDKTYTKLLKKMYLIEVVGEALYKELALKVKDSELKTVYSKLVKNEQQSASCIKRNIANNPPLFVQSILVNLATLVFMITPHRLLDSFLKRTLKKRMYSRWFTIYNHYNPELWRLLIEHEHLQHDSLSPYWDK